MTLDAFRTWEPADRSVRLWQLIDGEPVAMPLRGTPHCAIQVELGTLLRDHLLAHGSSGRVVVRPGIVPRIMADWNYRIPDIGITRAMPSAGVILPDPILLIEILDSRDDAEVWMNVWSYLTISGVAEVLVVDSTMAAAELITREAGGHWPAEPVRFGPDDTITLKSIDFAVPLRSFYRTTVLAMP
jgi:Uma2 family endonuclease